MEQMCRNVEAEIEFLRIGEIDNVNEKFTAEVKIIARWFLSPTCGAIFLCIYLCLGLHQTWV